MKKHITLLSVLISFALCGCTALVVDPGAPIDKVFQIDGNYNALYVANAFDVYVDKDATDVTVTVGENVMPHVIVEEVDGTLKIHIKSFTTLHSGPLKAIVPYSKALKNVRLSGASSFNSDFSLVDEKVNVSASGASSFRADVDSRSVVLDCSGASLFKGNVRASELTLDLSSAASVDIVGVTEILKFDMSGASKIMYSTKAGRYSLACKRCDGSISGASRAYIHCDEAIEVSVSGASDLHYTGDPDTSGISTSGASKIYHDVL